MGALSGASGRIIGMETFGASAPLKALQKRFGFEPDRVALVSQELLGRVMHECR
jgi:transketolase